jgi:hypothetical protein
VKPELQRRRAHRLDVKLPLVLEVMVEKPLRYAGSGGDIFDRDVFITPRREEAHAELEELCAALVRLQSESTASYHGALLTLPSRGSL